MTSTVLDGPNSLTVRYIPPPPQEPTQECTALLAELRTLQSDLDSASSGEKPSIIRQIVAVETEMRRLDCNY